MNIECCCCCCCVLAFFLRWYFSVCKFIPKKAERSECKWKTITPRHIFPCDKRMNVLCSATYMDKNEMMERARTKRNEINVSLQPNGKRETHNQVDCRLVEKCHRLCVYGLLWHDILINSKPKKKNETRKPMEKRTRQREREQTKKWKHKMQPFSFHCCHKYTAGKKTMKFIIPARANKEPTEMNEKIWETHSHTRRRVKTTQWRF